MYFHDINNRPFRSTLPGVRIRTFWGEEMLLAVVNLDANTVLPAHNHAHEQSSYILEGEMEFTIADQTRLVKPGDIVIIPGYVEHSAKVGLVDAKVLDIFTPVREDLKY